MHVSPLLSSLSCPQYVLCLSLSLCLCLQPQIAAFSEPLRRNCAGGDTGLIVNGRELPRRDLELLLRRGLPANVGKSYALDPSGDVWDTTTGCIVANLGALAPS